MKQMMKLSPQQFDRRNNRVGNRINTCMYRFWKIIQIRKKQIPKLSDNYDNQQVQNQVSEIILKTTDQYINCLRKQHYGGQIPEELLQPVNQFKNQVFTKLGNVYELEEARLKLARSIIDNNPQLM